MPARPYWALVPTLLCLYLEDMVTLACAAATASTDDSELLELQEAGVMMLTEVVRIFAQVMVTDVCDLSCLVLAAPVGRGWGEDDVVWWRGGCAWLLLSGRGAICVWVGR